MKVYFLGPVGTFTYQAARQHFDPLLAGSGQEAEYVPVAELSDLPRCLFAAATTAAQPDNAASSAAVDRAGAELQDVAVIPFENSTNGHVVPTLDAFRSPSLFPAECAVVGEIYLTVHQCLLGHPSLLSTALSTPSRSIASGRTDALAGAVNPDAGAEAEAALVARLRGVQRIYSHLQAFTQCNAFLARTGLDRLERVNVDSTGRAASLCAEDSESVAIASRVSASPTTAAVVLAADIEDNHDNTTRFLIIGRRPPSATGAAAASPSASESVAAASASSSDDDARQSRPQKSLISITVAHQKPGALAGLLSEFARHRINLTSIASRPAAAATSTTSTAAGASAAVGHKWRYIFFIEFEGGPHEKHVQKALDRIRATAETFRLLGSFDDLRRCGGS